MPALHRLAGLLVALTATLPLASCGGDEQAPDTAAVLQAPLSGSGPVYATLQAAAHEFHVPVRLLIAAAWSESRLTHRDSETEGRGLFQLDPTALDRAARLLDAPAETVAADLATHARGFAALVADDLGRDPDDTVSLDEWIDAVAGARTADAAAVSLAEGTRFALGHGVDEDTADGHILLAPSPLGTLEQAARPDTNVANRWVASTNYTNAQRRRGSVDTVVIHVTQGSYGGTISWFQNRASQVSSHYVVRSSDGQITQMVEEEDVAWHARNWNSRSIGIEHEGFVAEARWFTDAMYRRSAALTRDICQRWGIAMNRTHIKGHVELSGNDHTDPGPHWNWNRYMQLVTGGGDAAPPPAAATGRVRGFVRSGNIQNEAGGIANATVQIQGGPTVRTGGDGLYTFDGVSPGHKVILVSANGFAAGRNEVDAVAGQDVWGSVALQPGAQTGRLLGFVRENDLMNEAGPIAGAQVSVRGGPSVMTGADGLYRLPDLPVGDRTVTISKAGWQSQTVTRTVSVGADVWGSVGLVREAAPPPVEPPPVEPPPEEPIPSEPVSTKGALFGTIRTSGADGVLGPLDGASVSISGAASARTDADGRYRLDALPAGEVMVAVLASGHESVTRQVTILAGDEVELDVALTPRPGAPTVPDQAGESPTPAHPIGPPASAGDTDGEAPDPGYLPAPSTGDPPVASVDMAKNSGGCSQSPGDAPLPWSLLMLLVLPLTRRRRAFRTPRGRVAGVVQGGS